MKSKSIVLLLGGFILAWVFLFQGTQTASSSPLLRITFTPTATITSTATATRPPATLPPPPVLTNPPLIPVTGSEGPENMDLLIAGGMLLLVLGVVGMAWPEKRKAKMR